MVETVRGDCTRQIIDPWTGRLSVVDVRAHTYCETGIQHAIHALAYRFAYIRGNLSAFRSGCATVERCVR